MQTEYERLLEAVNEADKKINDEKKALISALIQLSNDHPLIHVEHADSFLALTLPPAVNKALNSETNIIGKLHRKNTLQATINGLIEQKKKEESTGFSGEKKLAEVRADVLEGVRLALNNTSSLTLPSPSYAGKSNFLLFSENGKLNPVKTSAVVIGAGLGTVGVLTAITLLIKSAAVVKTAATALAVATAASTAFPPALIAMIAIGGTALLVAGIVLAATAVQYYSQQQQIEKMENHQMAKVATNIIKSRG